MTDAALGLSVLELCLLIAMAHLTEKLDGEPFNGEMIYQGEFMLVAQEDAETCLHDCCASSLYAEYRKFASRSQSIDFLTKPVAMQV